MIKTIIAIKTINPQYPQNGAKTHTQFQEITFANFNATNKTVSKVASHAITLEFFICFSPFDKKKNRGNRNSNAGDQSHGSRRATFGRSPASV